MAPGRGRGAAGAATTRSAGHVAECSKEVGSLGILSADSLQCILKRSTPGSGKRRRQQEGGADAGRTPGDDGIVSPYDPSFTFTAHPLFTPRRQREWMHDGPEKLYRKEPRRHKRCSKEPTTRVVMPAVPTTNRCEGASVRTLTSSAFDAHSPAARTVKKRYLSGGNQAGSAQDLQHHQSSGAIRSQPSSSAQNAQSVPAATFLQQLPQVGAQRRGSAVIERSSAKLQEEIQWIHAHLPVLHLATSKCSLALRQQLFAKTVVANGTRALIRIHWAHWRWVCAEVKRVELLKLSASRCMVRLFQELSADLVRRRFHTWKEWMLESRSQEQLAACITIQGFVRQQRQRRTHEASVRTALDLKQALDRMHERARVIQRTLHTRAHVRRLQQCLLAVRRIQANVRSHQLRVRHRAATRIQQAFRTFADLKHANLAAMVALAHATHNARCIQRFWRSYAVWKHRSLPLICVGLLVDRVEYLAAIAVLQRHVVGFLCRRRLKKCHATARTIQTYWRSFDRRQSARRARKLALLSRSSAACCLQRTFKRNRERIKFRKMLQRSARPMYLRASGLGASFRQRFHVQIVKSAVFVIQSSWRRHLAYVAWRARRETAATRMQVCSKRFLSLTRWHRAVATAVRAHRQQQQVNAARRIQVCWRNHTTRITEDARAASVRLMHELAETLRAALYIQRYVRRRRYVSQDRWRTALLSVLQVELPRYRLAVKRIVCHWREYLARKQELMQRLGRLSGGPSGNASMDLASLKQLLEAQQLQAMREDSAARRIQRVVRRRADRRNGRLLLKRYKFLMQRDIRKREQRKIIHGFLDEREQERATRRAHKQQAHSRDSSGQSGTGGAAVSTVEAVQSFPGACGADQDARASTSGVDRGAGTGCSKRLPGANESNHGDAGTTGDDGEVVLQQFWSDEYQRAYSYNPHTGESVWL